MIRIYTNPNFLPEKKYTCKVLFSEILGLDFEIIISTSHTNSYSIILPNNAEIVCNDSFFSQFSETQSYCDRANIPSQILYDSQLIPNENIPIIYGNSEFRQLHTISYYTGIDIVASSFFMLSRWEEIAISNKDAYGRFPEELSLAVKFGFIRKPLVHLYSKIIQTLSFALGFEIQTKHAFTKTLSHDIDFVYKWHSFYDVITTIGGDIFKRRSLATAFSNIRNFIQGNDPYNTYEKLCNFSNSIDCKSTFYFLVNEQNKKELQSKNAKIHMQCIVQDDHNIGIHLNNYTVADYELALSHKQFLESIFKQKVVLNRQHFLQLQVPETFKFFDLLGITEDSSMYYRNFAGFRTGMCVLHSLFNCIERTEFIVKELPLIVMDVTLLQYHTLFEAKKIIDELFAETKNYNGNFVCLWHNSSFDKAVWQKYVSLYQYIVQLT